MTTNAKKTKSKRNHKKPNKVNQKVNLKRIQNNAEILRKLAEADK
jgi:hypothetical protein